MPRVAECECYRRWHTSVGRSVGVRACSTPGTATVLRGLEVAHACTRFLRNEKWRRWTRRCTAREHVTWLTWARRTDASRKWSGSKFRIRKTTVFVDGTVSLQPLAVESFPAQSTEIQWWSDKYSDVWEENGEAMNSAHFNGSAPSELQRGCVRMKRDRTTALHSRKCEVQRLRVKRTVAQHKHRRGMEMRVQKIPCRFRVSRFYSWCWCVRRRMKREK